jgi:hypothetical protein
MMLSFSLPAASNTAFAHESGELRRQLGRLHRWRWRRVQQHDPAILEGSYKSPAFVRKSNYLIM